MSEHSEARAKLVCSVCLEEVHQECGKHTSNEQINASLMCFLILADGLWFQWLRSASGMRKTH